MLLWLTVATAFALGLLHALDADHVIAVTTFIVRRPQPRAAVSFALRWGVGHMVPLLVLGVGGILLGVRIPAAFGRAAETLVGGALIALGGFVFRDLWRRKIHLHVHEHDGVRHAHLHSHAEGDHHAHVHAPSLVGVVHGLAGTASVFVVIPVTVLASPWAAALYIGVFSAAVIGMMALYGYWAGSFLGRLHGRFPKLYRVALAVTGGLSVCAGGLWLARLL